MFLLLSSFWMVAQVQYLDPQYATEVESGVVYAENISILRGMPEQIPLTVDIYTPVGDDNQSRPLMLVAHTGSFLPPLFNGGVTGATTDSTVTHICRELARRGYVAAAYTYRQGWLPTAPDEDVRRSTLLQAAFRGIQDTRSCVRYFRKTVAEENNPYNISSENIGVVGVGTGGYLAYGAGTLYDFEEVQLPKFIDTQTALPYIDSTLYGNLFGDTQTPLCLPNHPGYSSDIEFAFNLGGAMGDISWMDGEEQEPMYAGVHATNDIFAPFTVGPVIVPTTMEFVVNVAGTHAAISTANANGTNDGFSDILDDPLADLIAEQKTQTFTPPGFPMAVQLGADNFYAFKTPFPEGSPWDWWDKATLDLVVAGTNAVAGTSFNADTLHRDGLITNRDMSPEKGRTYMDTIFQLMLPRSCVAMNLACQGVLSSNDLVQHEISISPNPAYDRIVIETGEEIMRSIVVTDISGKIVRTYNNVNDRQQIIDRNTLGSGVYIAQLLFENGQQAVKFVLK